MEIAERISDEITSEARLASFEAKCGGKLPQEYRAFLLAANGGRPVKRRFSFLDNGKRTESVVDWFFGDCDDPDYGLVSNLEVYEGRIPNGWLPVATDPFGNLILLSLKGNVSGIVSFWDHEREDPDDFNKNVLHLADNFNAFLAGLT